jgi:hypothetical protein
MGRINFVKFKVLLRFSKNQRRPSACATTIIESPSNALRGAVTGSANPSTVVSTKGLNLFSSRMLAKSSRLIGKAYATEIVPCWRVVDHKFSTRKRVMCAIAIRSAAPLSSSITMIVRSTLA